MLDRKVFTEGRSEKRSNLSEITSLIFRNFRLRFEVFDSVFYVTYLAHFLEWLCPFNDKISMENLRLITTVDLFVCEIFFPCKRATLFTKYKQLLESCQVSTELAHR